MDGPMPEGATMLNALATIATSVRGQTGVTNEQALATKLQDLRSQLRVAIKLLAISVYRLGGQMIVNSDEDDFNQQAKITDVGAGCWKVENTQ